MEPTESNFARAAALIPRVISSFVRAERPQVTSKHVRWAVAHELGLHVKSFESALWKSKLKEATIDYLQVHPDQVEPNEPALPPAVPYDGIQRTIAELNVLSTQPLAGSSTTATLAFAARTPVTVTPPPAAQDLPATTAPAVPLPAAVPARQQQQQQQQSPAAKPPLPRREPVPPACRKTAPSPPSRSRKLPRGPQSASRKPASSSSSSAPTNNKRPLPNSSPNGSTSVSRLPPPAKRRAAGPSTNVRDASSESGESEPEKDDSGDEYRSNASVSDSDDGSADEDDDYERGKRRRSSTGKGKATLTGADAKAAEHVDELKEIYKALGHRKTKWANRFRGFEYDYYRQAEYISCLCKKEGMTEPFSLSQARKVKVQRERDESEDYQQSDRKSALRGRDARSSSTASQPTHGRNTRSTAPPVVVPKAPPRVVRTEKWHGGHYAYVEVDDGVLPAAGPAQPANMQSILGFLGDDA